MSIGEAILNMFSLLTPATRGTGESSTEQAEVTRATAQKISPPPQSSEDPLDDYVILRELGKGADSEVYVAREKATGREVACKIIRKAQKRVDQLERIRFEGVTTMSFDHPNIVKTYRMFETERYLVLVQQLAKGGDLLDYVNSRPRLPEPAARKIFLQVLSALSFAHSHGICHHDVKLENIFLDEQGNALLGDWGYCQRFEAQKPMKLTFGSIFYSSPEVVSGRPYFGPEVDLWGLAVCLYGMVQGVLPWMGETDEETRQAIRRANLVFVKPLSDDCRRLLTALLLLDRAHRLVAIATILDHPWASFEHVPSAAPCLSVSPVPSAEPVPADSPARVLSY